MKHLFVGNSSFGLSTSPIHIQELNVNGDGVENPDYDDAVEAGPAGAVVTPPDGPKPQPEVPASIETPEQLVEEVIAELPMLGGSRAALEALMTWYITYAAPDLHPDAAYTREQAFAELLAARRLTPEDVQTFLTECRETIGSAMETIATQFAEEVSAGEVLPFQAISNRYVAEMTEQENLRTQAINLLALVREVCDHLQIPNPNVPQAPATHTENTPEKRGLTDMLLKVFVAGQDEPEQPAPVAPPTPPASWNTPPVLALNDKDIEALQIVIAPRARQVSKSGIAAVKMILSGLSLDEEEIQAILERVVAKARAQLQQCEEVSDNIVRSHTRYLDARTTIMGLDEVLQEVHNFFFPAEA